MAMKIFSGEYSESMQDLWMDMTNLVDILYRIA